MFQIRTAKPSGNKCYIRKASGGWSNAIKGKPTDKHANVLSNCVGYANGRFAEIINEIRGTTGIKYQLVCNAEDFIEKAKKMGLEIATHPTLGGIMVWQKGKIGTGSDGAGHVAIVEKIIDDNTIYTSESNYGGTAFLNCTRHNSTGRWGLSSKYKFRGCIINPAVRTEPEKTIDELAHEVLDGLWGNGSERKRRLTEAGYDYYAVQKRVNELLKGEIKVGDTVKVTNPINYTTGKRFTLWYKTYTVMQLKGDRAVIGHNGKVTSAINVKYLERV